MNLVCIVCRRNLLKHFLHAFDALLTLTNKGAVHSGVCEQELSAKVRNMRFIGMNIPDDVTERWGGK